MKVQPVTELIDKPPLSGRQLLTTGCGQRWINYSLDKLRWSIGAYAGSADGIEQVVQQQQLGDRQRLTAGAVTDMA